MCVCVAHRMLTEGFRSLAAGTPNMNSLVAMGCTTSFLVSEVSISMCMHVGVAQFACVCMWC